MAVDDEDEDARADEIETTGESLESRSE